MKRILDIIIAIILGVVVFFPSVFVSIVIKMSSPGGVFYFSERVGRHGKLFMMPKFRTMRTDAPEVATDELVNPSQYITPIGIFLRKSSFDEIPQIFLVLIGKMSFVGPRPALLRQKKLNGMRAAMGVDELLPGITGWAQVNGRDTLNDKQKADFDFEYLCRKSVIFDIWIMFITVKYVIQRKSVRF